MKQSRAKGKVMLAISRLAADMPLHAGILGRWRLMEDAGIGTMAVGFRHGRLTLYFDPAFIERTSLADLVGVVEHECLHVVLGHVFHEASPTENTNARTASEETCVNEIVGHSLPGKPVLLEHFPGIPPNEDTETRYERLKDVVPDVKIITIDDHARWAEILANGELAAAVIRTVVGQAWGKLTPEQKAKINLPEATRKAVEDAVKLSGALVIGEGTASVPWQQMLRRYVGRELMRRPVFGRVPRRFPELVGVIPATGRSVSKPRVVVCIDTSGSISSATLSQFTAEIQHMAKVHEVWVIEADNVVRAAYRFKGAIESVSGRGGTSFIPALAEAARLKCDVAIYMTDGCGKAPESAPRFPVIWCLTRNGKHPCSWGRVIRMTG